MEGDPPPVEERRRLQEELSEFVESCCRRLEEVTASLGWSLDRLDPEKEVSVSSAVSLWGPWACGLLWRRRNPLWGREGKGVGVLACVLSRVGLPGRAGDASDSPGPGWAREGPWSVPHAPLLRRTYRGTLGLKKM